MRHLMHRRAARGLTLIELMVTVAIAGILMMAGMPYLGDYIQNSRLREAGNSAYSSAMYAQSEAIKRNGRVRLSIDGSTVQVIDRVGLAAADAGTVLRTVTLPDGVRLSAAATVDFGSEGRTWPAGTTQTFNFIKTGVTCSTDIRCPALVVEAGGGVRLCPIQSQCS
ncbi:GspH/FimT family pseudopilin [Aquincola tertiaricarbonis]|uniref:Type II secretion system protein H n=1 Tax=Aquincola tertiaricarbonis TaxID=391953 RepID=A0ABY4SD99_AQUTE|nr:GspH/FimT family pseudopilin [Aquincola tertiaricarbonis]URI09708.1 GspH/FimT family pseudopilin [Aquincola tertiaricarbonis]